jgi:hypothetical protein
MQPPFKLEFSKLNQRMAKVGKIAFWLFFLKGIVWLALAALTWEALQ